ncbi:YraN family protein [Melioribacter sp. Ez-97]|uniref:YraN family protein n=1 Tax=Melioribacter sp. Ez-97 TaxID=3423434 RepID=UPI003ED910E6
MMKIKKQTMGGVNKRERGNLGEEIACNYLINKGMTVIDRNYHYGHGEIDIICKDNDTIVFVEVKYRKSLKYGEPEFAITKNKQRQIRKIAEAYLYEKKITDQPCRIDVITIVHEAGKEPALTHYRDAF